MRNSTNAIAEQAGGVAVSAERRVIFSMGGKGGVGKTSVMAGLAEWFDENQIPVVLLDLDTENKACGSLTHFFTGRVPKINIHTPAGLDAFIDLMGGGPLPGPDGDPDDSADFSDAPDRPSRSARPAAARPRLSGQGFSMSSAYLVWRQRLVPPHPSMSIGASASGPS